MGLISQIKADVAKSGANKGKILYIRADSKIRIRFLQELDDGYSFVFHDNFNEGINCFCPRNIDEDNECVYCDETAGVQVRTRNLYAWSIYNYDTKQVEIALWAVNQFTPVNQLISMSEAYGTIIDRDYVITRTGKQMETAYAVIPQDKEKFRNPKAKPFSQSAMMKILSEAFKYSDDDEEEEEEKPKKAKVSEKLPKAKKEKEKKYAEMPEDEDEGVPWVDKPKASKEKKAAAKKESPVTEDWIEDQLDENDIDEDDFLEYNEYESLEDMLELSKSEIKNLIKEYLDEEDEDE